MRFALMLAALACCNAKDKTPCAAGDIVCCIERICDKYGMGYGDHPACVEAAAKACTAQARCEVKP